MPIEKSVFISYRRTNSYHARAIFQDLRANRYDVFMDYESIDSGAFDQIILNQIKARAHFIVILTPSALERCVNPNDWLRREIETAIEYKRNIVPLMFEGFDWKDYDRALADYNRALQLDPNDEIAKSNRNIILTSVMDKPICIYPHPPTPSPRCGEGGENPFLPCSLPLLSGGRAGDGG